MNVALFIYCKTEKALQSVRLLANSAIHHLRSEKVLPAEGDVFIKRVGRSLFVNTQVGRSAWQVPVVFCSGENTLSLSALPIPTDRTIDANSLGADIISRLDQRRDLEKLLPPFFGNFATKDHSGVFTDCLGLGRAYFLENEHFFAASNNIGACLFFSPDPPEEDHQAWQLFSGFGWFVGDTSPYRRVKRLPPATIISFDAAGVKKSTTYFDYSSLYRARDPDPNEVERTKYQMTTAAKNIAALAVRSPVVMLSGGRDSRVTAATFLSAGVPVELSTVGTLSGEAQVAKELVKLAGAEAQHTISLPSSMKQSQSIAERLARCMAAWDGDMNPNRISQTTVFGANSRLTIGGGGGELAHGNWYATPELLDRMRQIEKPTDRLASSFAGNAGVTPASAELIKAFLRQSHDILFDAGMRGPSILDGFYLIERFRRWVAAGHYTSGPVLYGCISFVRLSMDQTPEERYAVNVQRSIIQAMIPDWQAVPFYKAKPSNRDEKEERGLRLWQGPYEDEFFDTLLAATRNDIWDGRAVLEQAVKVLRGQSQVRYEATFQKIIWHSGFRRHLELLQKRTTKAWARTALASGAIRSL